jgi:Holliday junction resolvase RusA-like endonuclease
MLTFTIPGAPVAKGRAKLSTVNGHARAYTPTKTRNYESLVALAAEQAMRGRAPFDGPLALQVTILLGVPESWSKKKRAACLAYEVLPTKKPDIDNVTKSVLDGMNAVAFVDDSRIVDLVVKKRYSDSPRVVVELEQLAGLSA